jgi:hypothetical protein
MDGSDTELNKALLTGRLFFMYAVYYEESEYEYQLRLMTHPSCQSRYRSVLCRG